jgi:hypothetical protein
MEAAALPTTRCNGWGDLATLPRTGAGVVRTPCCPDGIVLSRGMTNSPSQRHGENFFGVRRTADHGTLMPR